MKNTNTMTVREAAQSLGWTRKYVYDLLYDGRIEGAQKVGRTWNIPRKAIQERLSRREKQTHVHTVRSVRPRVASGGEQ